ncbi:MAG TPA: MFS transporter [Gaiellaceae bacterium]|nr:MFS transporter [Gaiellaceae bacterium]
MPRDFGGETDPAGESARPGRGGLLARVAVDLTPLRVSQPFRRLWFGQAVSAIGNQITTVALPFQLYELTHSTLLVGLLGLAALVPLLTVPLLAGAAADTADRRRLMLAGEVVILTASASLLVNVLVGEPRVWVLFAAEVLGTTGWSIARPAMSAATPRLVPRNLIPSAVAVQSVYSNFAHVAGPALGGVLIAAIGLRGVYLLDVATFGASITAAYLLPAIPPSEAAGERGLRSILEGLRYVRSRRVLLGIFLVDTNAMIFGMPSALFPAFAEHLGGGPRTVGILFAAPYAGAFAASLVSGWIAHVRRQGLGVCLAAAGWGVAIAVFGLTSSLLPAATALAFAGAADFISAVLRDAILLTASPDELRGRLSGIELAQVAGAPALGNLEAGVVASLASVRTSIVSGGILTVAGTVAIALAVPALVRHDALEPRRE